MSQQGMDFKAMNQAMATRLLDAPAEPIPAGGYGLRVLEVVGRQSGQPVRTPIGVLEHDGGHYLVCPDRTRDWPKNVAAAGRVAILGGGVSDDFASSEVTGPAAAEVVAAYVGTVTAPWALAAFGLPANATPDDVLPHLERMAVFELTAAPESA